MNAEMEGISLCQLNNPPTSAHLEKHAASQAYIADTLTTAEKIPRSERIDYRLHVTMCTLTHDDKPDVEDVRRGWETTHHSTQARLAKVVEIGMTDPLSVKRVPTFFPTLAKVDTSFSGGSGQMALEEPAMPTTRKRNSPACHCTDLVTGDHLGVGHRQENAL